MVYLFDLEGTSSIVIQPANGSNVLCLFTLQAGQAVHVGGLMRLDLNQASVETIYVTIWASPNVSVHMGKIENADEIWRKHVGVRLQVNFCPNKIPSLYQFAEIVLSLLIWFYDFHVALNGLCFLLKFWSYHPSNKTLLIC